MKTILEALDVKSLEIETRAKIVELFNEGAPMEMVYSMLQGLVDKLAKKKQYITMLKLDFSDNYKIELEITEDKPLNWSGSYIRDFLRKVGEVLGRNQILMYSFTLRYDRPVLIEVGEVPKNRQTSLNFKKPPAKFDENFYQGQE